MKYAYKAIAFFAVAITSVNFTSCQFNWPWARTSTGISQEQMVIRKRVGQEVEIEVKRGKKGYTWHMLREPNPSILKLDEKDMPRTKRARSEYEWEYDAVGPGTTWIVLEQRDPNGNVMMRRTYKIVIAPRKSK